MKATPEPWSPTYLDTIQGGSNHGLHLLGWTGDYNDTYNFIGTFFGAESAEWGFDDPDLFQSLSDARYADVDAQEDAVQGRERGCDGVLPGVPLASPVPSLAFTAQVQGYPVSPVQDEVYSVITFSE